MIEDDGEEEEEEEKKKKRRMEIERNSMERSTIRGREDGMLRD